MEGKVNVGVGQSANLPPWGGESIFLHLRAGLPPSKCLENAREGIS